MIKVFIENEAGSDRKNLFNEKTLEHKGSVTVSRKYPYPYGFILDTTSGDGDNVDCFVITERKLKTGQIVECEPVGIMEQSEDGEEDNNILAVMKGEGIAIDEKLRKRLADFVSHVFDRIEGKKVVAGDFQGKAEAISYIRRCSDKGT